MNTVPRVATARTKHVVSVSGGKDSAATLLLAYERVDPTDLMPAFCDTGNEHEAVYEYLDYLELALDIKIVRLKANFSDQIDVRRKRLLAIASGAPFRKGKYPWTAERAARAADLMYSTGNPFLDLCLLHGMFPTQLRKFCTKELKIHPLVEYQLSFVDDGHRVVSWQGVRRDESLKRRDAKKMERVGPRIWAFRPLVEWTAQNVFDYCKSKKIEPNPLYKQGMSRVGCMPCINVNKEELRQIALRFPDHIDRIREWEKSVNECSRSGMASFLNSGGYETIDQRVEWSKTSKGKRNYDIFLRDIDTSSCASSYGLCE